MTTELKDVLEAVLTDLIQARHEANKFSMSISPRYVGSGDMADLQTPSLDIGTVKVDIRFAIKPPDEDSPGGEEANNLDPDHVLGSIREGALGSINRSLPEIGGDSDRSMLSMRVSNAVNDAMDPKTLNIDKRKARENAKRVLSEYAESRRGGNRIDHRVLNGTVTSMINDIDKRVKESAEEFRGKQRLRAGFIVDAKELNQLDPAAVSSLSLDLDLSSLEWRTRAKD